MTGTTKSVSNMVIRLLLFAIAYAQLFAEGSVAAELVEQLKKVSEKFAANSGAQFFGQGAVKRSSVDRTRARKAVRSQLTAISRIAQGLQLPEFLMPLS